MLFGLFNRTKIENWEIELLRGALTRLSIEYSKFISQIDDGLLRNVLTTHGSGYISFGFNPQLLKKYEKRKERDFKVTNIKVYDSKTCDYLSYSIYMSSGMIAGYALGAGKKHKVDINTIDVSNFRKEFFENSDYKRIALVLDKQEKELINPADIYAVSITDKEYFHIKDLEDGDFIALDVNKVVYKVTHDPLEVIKLEKSIVDILK